MAAHNQPDPDHEALLFSRNPSPLWICDQETLAFLAVNDAAVGQYGWSREEFLAMSLLDVLPAEDRPVAGRQFIENIRSEARTAGVLRHRRKDGSIRQMEVLLSSIPFAGRAGRLCLMNDVTERTRSEEAEQRFMALMNHNPCLVFMKDEDGRYVYLNETYENQFVHTKGWLGKTDYDFWPRESAELFRTNDVEVLKSGRVRQFMEDSIGPDGKRYCWLNYKFPFTDAKNQRYVGGVGIDATARVVAEEALREHEAEFAEAQSISRIGCWSHDLASGRISWSDELYSIFGLDKSEPPTAENLFLRRVHPDDRPRVEQAIAGAMSAGNSFGLEYRIVTPAGETKHVRDLVKVTKDAEGKVIRIFGTTQDATERVRAEATLRESEERFRSVLESSRDVIYRYNIQKVAFEYVSSASEEVVGYSREEIMQMDAATAHAMIHPDDVPVFEAALNRLNEVGEAEVEYRQLSKDGEYRWLSNRMSLTRDEAGAPLYRNGNIRDITERKNTEQDLRRAKENLELRVEERTKELSESVHALNRRTEQLQSLAADLTMAEQRERRRLAQVLHDGLQQILVAARLRLSKLARGGDADARHRAGEVIDLLQESIEISRSLTAELSPPILYEAGLVAALEWLARWMQEKQHLAVELHGKLQTEKLPENLSILLFHATRELLFNIVKHSKAKRATVKLKQHGDGTIVIKVSDNGVGFDPDRLHRVGEKTGLGLFSIRERIGIIGGKFEIDSAPGRGSVFTLSVPFDASKAGAAAGEAEHEAGAAVTLVAPRDRVAGGIARCIRVMLVDDHIVLRQGLRALLRGESDLEVIGEASDGESAIALAREIHPDVILMDIGMPRMNGIEATRIIHREMPDISIIGLSMFEEADVANPMLEAGAVRYLVKTGPSNELIHAVRECAE